MFSYKRSVARSLCHQKLRFCLRMSDKTGNQWQLCDTIIASRLYYTKVTAHGRQLSKFDRTWRYSTHSSKTVDANVNPPRNKKSVRMKLSQSTAVKRSQSFCYGLRLKLFFLFYAIQWRSQKFSTGGMRQSVALLSLNDKNNGTSARFYA